MARPGFRSRNVLIAPSSQALESATAWPFPRGTQCANDRCHRGLLRAALVKISQQNSYTHCGCKRGYLVVSKLNCAVLGSGAVYSISPGQWQFIKEHLDEQLRFKSVPPGTVIPLHGKLLSVCRKQVQVIADLDSVPITRRRLWMRVSNLQSSKRKMSMDSIRILHIFERWLLRLSPFRYMRPPAVSKFEARADARADGATCSIGGYVARPAMGQNWFSETFSFMDFQRLGAPVNEAMQKDVACYEALAQGALILASASLLPCCRVPIVLRSASDNTSAEAGVSPLFTTAFPPCLFLEHVALWVAMHCVSLDVSHIPGEENGKSDALSRPLERATPAGCLPHERIRVSLSSLRSPRPQITTAPEGASLFWKVQATQTANLTSTWPLTARLLKVVAVGGMWAAFSFLYMCVRISVQSIEMKQNFIARHSCKKSRPLFGLL